MVSADNDGKKKLTALDDTMAAAAAVAKAEREIRWSKAGY